MHLIRSGLASILLISLIARAQVAPPTITAQPATPVFDADNDATLTVTATGAAPVSYRWFKNGTALADGGDLSGTSTSTLAFTAAQPADDGSYVVIVSNSGGSVISNAVTVTVAIAGAPSITSAVTAAGADNQPLNYTITATASPTSFGATGLPQGLSVNAATGVISGTPNGIDCTYSVTLSATNSAGTGTATLLLTIGTAPSPGFADKVVHGVTLGTPTGMACDASGNLYYADAGTDTIYKVSGGNGPFALLVGLGSTVVAGSGQGGSADGIGSAAGFLDPGGVAVDAAGNIYVADTGNNTIREISPSGVTMTLAGSVGQGGSADGVGSAARFYGPKGLAVDLSGDVYVADTLNQTIRKIAPNGTVTTLAGTPGQSGDADGPAGSATFNQPNSVAVDSSGNVYVVDGGNHAIRKISGGTVTTFAGASANLSQPDGISLDGSGNIVVSDTGNNAIKRITPAGVVTVLSFTGALQGILSSAIVSLTPGQAVAPADPSGMAIDPSGNLYWFNSSSGTYSLIEALIFTSPVSITTPASGPSGAQGVGSSSTLTVGASGGPVYYYWTGPNSAQPVNSTTSSLVVNGPNGGISPTNSGTYTVYVFNASSWASSSTSVTFSQASISSLTATPNPATVGDSVTLNASVASLPYASFSVVWQKNGVNLAAAQTVANLDLNGDFTGTSYPLGAVSASDAGAYTLVVNGTVSDSVTLAVNLPSAPTISSPTSSGTLSFGGSLPLSVTAGGAGPFTYQWQINGTAIAGATFATYAATAPGTYSVLITNAGGSTTSGNTVLTAANRLINISTRAYVGTGQQIEIAGFVVDGPAGVAKQVLIRGLGPSLANYGLAGALAQPVISVADASGTIIASNTGWGTAPNAAQMPAVGASVGDVVPFTIGSADSALLLDLEPGSYTVELSGSAGAGGVGLVEVYETDTSDPDLFADISTRAYVGTGEQVEIAGFVVGGSQPATVLIRGSGPALANFGVSGVLAEPTLTVINNTTDSVVATNTGWGTASNAAQMPAAGSAAGSVIPFTSASADSALLLTLPPGSYSAEVSGANGALGIALIEVYQSISP